MTKTKLPPITLLRPDGKVYMRITGQKHLKNVWTAIDLYRQDCPEATVIEAIAGIAEFVLENRVEFEKFRDTESV